MARTKKDILKLYKKNKKLKTTAKIYEIINGRSIPAFDVKVIEDNRGFYRETILKSAKDKDSSWVESAKGLDMVRIKEFDSNMCEVEIPKSEFRSELKFEIRYGDLCDLITAFMAGGYVLNKNTGLVGKTPVKIGNLKTRRVK